MLKLAVFASGRGSNFRALIEKIHRPRRGASIRLLVSDNQAAPALRYAQEENIPILLVSYKEGKKNVEDAIASAFARYEIDLAVLCGYMRVLSPDFVRCFRNKIINIHPALLPSFPGLHAQRQALAHGVKVTGCTVHFVDAGVDTGKIILQEAVRVEENDTEETLSARILMHEHELLPKAIEYLAKHGLM